MFFLCVLFSLGLLAYAQSVIPLGDLPLAVKTPYLHSWTQSNDLKAPEQVWPNIFSQDKILGWNGMVRVDGQPFQWLGNTLTSIANFSNTIASTITPTKTIFTIQAGPMKFNATFFSPIEPNDYTRQSIPFTYLYLDGFTANDGMPHTIQVYSDISAEWVSHDELTRVTWGTSTPNNMVYHHIAPANPKSMKDNGNSAEDSTGYYATSQRSGLTWQTGADVDCRTKFAQSGNLGNSQDTEFRTVKDRWPVFSFAIDLGSIAPNNQQPDPVVWALGLVRNPLVKYGIQSTLQLRTGYYWSSYQTIGDVITDFLGDFTSARLRSQDFDDSILNAALQISSHYAEILSLVTRQVFASMDITIPVSAGGQPNASDVKIFMKDISVSTRANPVEVIYAALPALIYFNSSFVHDLLSPLLEFQSSPNYQNSYASPDLGSGYPVVGGNTSITEELAIEHSGNMLIMTYAYAAKTGDPSLISQYHPLLQKWAEYLVQKSLHPSNAVSADGFGYPDMSNLALKGILGIYSMGKIDEVMNPSNTTFKDKATELFNEWKQLAVMDTHIQARYGKPETWGLMYNFFPAVWLEIGLIDDDLLNREASFYLNNAPPADKSYSLDNLDGNDIAYPHWALMTAAIMPSGFTSVRDHLIKSTYLQAFNSTQKFPLPMKYAASTGVANSGFSTGSAAQGAAFGILAMGMKNVKINPVGSRGSANAEKKSSVGGIVGGIIGGLAFLLIVATAVLLWRRRRAQRSKVVVDLRDDANLHPHPFLTHYSPAGADDSAFHLNKSSPVDGYYTPSGWRGPLTETWSPPLRREGSYSDASGRSRSLPTTPATPPTPLPQTLSSKQREALQQQNQSHRHQPSMSAVSSVTNPYSAHGSGREDLLRAEVEELRREMEAIRHIAQPPPSYQ